jgi:hypothetical protein
LDKLRFFARFKRYFSRQKLLPPPPRETGRLHHGHPRLLQSLRAMPFNLPCHQSLLG